MRKFFSFLFVIFVCVLFVGCKDKQQVQSISLADNQLILTSEFNLSDISLIVKMVDGTEKVVTLSADVLSEEDLNKLRSTGNHQITVKYLGAEQTLNINIRADETEFRIADNYLQWKYKSESTWKNLLSLDDLKGADGKDGVDGKDGKDGVNGQDGVTPTVEISSDGFWVINGVKTDVKARVDVEEKDTYKITYVLNGGALPKNFETAEVVAGSPVFLPIPYRDGYSFVGWFDENGYSPTVYDVVNADLTLYAKWEKEESDLGKLIKKFTSDNYTVRLYGSIGGDSDDMIFMSILFVKSKQDDLVTYYMEQPMAMVAYQAYDNEYEYYYIEELLSNIFEFDFEPAESEDDFIIPYKFEYLYPMDFEVVKPGVYQIYLEHEDLIQFTGYEDYEDYNYAYAIFDVEAQKFEFDLYSSYEGEDPIQIIELYLSDVDTTKIEFPYDKIIEPLREQLFAKKEVLPDESIPAYEEFLTAFLDDYENVSSLKEFAQFYHYYSNAHLGFKEDSFKAYRKEAIDDLWEMVERYSQYATAESIMEMERICAEGTEAIESATTTYEVFMHIENYEEEILNAYVLDPAKQALLAARDNAANAIYFIYSEIYFSVYYFECPNLSEIFERYLQRIEESEDLEEIQSLPAALSKELSELELVYNRTLDINKAKYSKQVQDYYNIIPNRFKEKYEDELEAALAEINGAVKPINFEKVVENFMSAVLAGLYSDYQELIDSQYDYYLKIVADSDVNMLNYYHDKYLTDLETVADPDGFEYLFTNYKISLGALTIDPLKSNMQEYLLSFENLYEVLSFLTTEESLPALETAYLAGCEEIRNSTWVGALDEAYTAARDGLYSAYQEDSAKWLYYKHSQVSPQVMNKILSFFKDLTGENNDYIAAFNLTDKYLYLIANATTTAEIEQFYQEWFDGMMKIPAIYNSTTFYHYRNSFVNTLSNYLNENLEPTNEHFETLEAFIEEINSTNYFPTIIENTYEFYMLFFDVDRVI